VNDASVERIWQNFHEVHALEYGHAFPSNPIDLVNLRVTGIGPMPKPGAAPVVSGASVADARLKTADTYFRVDGRLERYPTEFYERDRLPVGAVIDGPAVIFQKDSTTVLPPGSRATVDESGNIHIALGAVAPREADGARGHDVAPSVPR
jgi:N-methylhydantoinase A